MAEKKRGGLGVPAGRKPGFPFIFFPTIEPDTGTGHLHRALRLARELKNRGFLLLEKARLKARPELIRLLKSFPEKRIISSARQEPAGSVFVFDRRETCSALFSAYAGRQALIGLDEGGRRRARFPFLIDTFPRIKWREEPNLRALPCGKPGKAVPRRKRPFKKFLVSFGGEDRAGLSTLLVELLLEQGFFPAENITLVEGPFFKQKTWPDGISVIRGCDNVAGIISGYDLLFTHYGLSCYEALLAGVPVILLNPSAYHQKLARRDGIPEIGVRGPSASRLRSLLADHNRLRGQALELREKMVSLPALEEVLASLAARGRPDCPVCLSQPGNALARFTQKTYFRCPGCGVIWLSFWGGRRRYHDAYFFEEYRAQYGKTYLEDFEAIKTTAGERLAVIKRFLRPPGNASGGVPRVRLLDVGAAYGPFLAAAKENGFQAEGIEINRAAARFIRKSLGIACVAGDFLKIPVGLKKPGRDRWTGVRFAPNSYDIITMWYILEHFDNVAAVLTKINRLLKPGGVFAFSTPSASGISSLKNGGRFLRQSPDDHLTLWSPRTARTMLRRFGFRVVSIRSTGHHPERFFRRIRGKVLPSIVGFFSRLFSLGDTFEAYAVKVREAR